MLSQYITTPVGILHAVWTEAALLQSCSFTDATGVDSTAWWCFRNAHAFQERQHHLKSAFTRYFEIGVLQWDLAWLDWTNLTEFHQRVLRQCFAIPSGQTMSYGKLATRVGSDGAARAVGVAMARNRWPLLIPCHRVVGSSGRLTGYSGTGGIATKRWLLDLESGLLAGKNIQYEVLS